MAESVDLKQMVQTFRVSELQVLLGFAGKNKSGRKTEMMSRALDLVSRRVSSSVQEKVKELYRRRYPTRASNKESTQPTPAAQSSNGSAFCPKKSWSKDYSSQQQQSLNQMTSPPSTSSRSHHHHSSSHHHQSSSSSSVGMNAYASAAAAAAPSSQATHQNYSGLHIPVNPDVTLKNLPFYDTLGVLLKPSSLVARSPSRFQEAFFVFHLTPQQTNAIMNSRDTRPNSKCEYTVQVQMRFCLLETSCDQEDVFPPSICVRVNGKVAPLPNPIPTNKPGMEPKRPGRPVNITYISRISATVSNHINVSWASEYGRVFCVSVYLVKALTSDVLYQRLKHKGVRHSDHTRALIKEKLAHDPDSEIATTSLRVSLRCPLGKMRMTTPCRAITCNHLQCFDLSMYLQMNERKPTWMCPVCDKPAGYKKLFIDGLFTEINLKNPDSDEMEFFEDGSWQPRKENDDKQRDESANVVQAIGIDDDVSFSSSPKTQNVSDGLGGGSGSAAGAEVSVIDLTETDDEVSDAETEIQAAPGAGNESVVDSASHLSSPRPPSINNISMSSSDESTPTHISHDRRGNDNGPLVWQSASTPDAAQTSQPTTNPGYISIIESSDEEGDTQENGDETNSAQNSAIFSSNNNVNSSSNPIYCSPLAIQTSSSDTSFGPPSPFHEPSLSPSSPNTHVSLSQTQHSPQTSQTKHSPHTSQTSHSPQTVNTHHSPVHYSPGNGIAIGSTDSAAVSPQHTTATHNNQCHNDTAARGNNHSSDGMRQSEGSAHHSNAGSMSGSRPSSRTGSSVSIMSPLRSSSRSSPYNLSNRSPRSHDSRSHRYRSHNHSADDLRDGDSKAALRAMVSGSETAPPPCLSPATCRSVLGSRNTPPLLHAAHNPVSHSRYPLATPPTPSMHQSPPLLSHPSSPHSSHTMSPSRGSLLGGHISSPSPLSMLPPLNVTPPPPVHPAMRPPNHSKSQTTSSSSILTSEFAELEEYMNIMNTISYNSMLGGFSGSHLGGLGMPLGSALSPYTPDYHYNAMAAAALHSAAALHNSPDDFSSPAPT